MKNILYTFAEIYNDALNIKQLDISFKIQTASMEAHQTRNERTSF